MLKVLVIDAATATRRRLCNWLVELGHAAMGCPVDADAVRRACAEFAPDNVVIDVPLHNDDGYGLISAIRHRRPSARIVALSNEVTPEFVRRSLDAGADAALSKVFEFETVLDLVCTTSPRR